jgi:hypothetical protein
MILCVDNGTAVVVDLLRNRIIDMTGNACDGTGFTSVNVVPYLSKGQCRGCTQDSSERKSRDSSSKKHELMGAAVDACCVFCAPWAVKLPQLKALNGFERGNDCRSWSLVFNADTMSTADT